jgi:hypothetical protein
LFACNKCGSYNRMGDQSCKKCGAQFQYHCPMCRSQIKGGELACQRCGNRITWPEAPNELAGRDKQSGAVSANRSTESWIAPLVGLIVIVAITGLAVYYFTALAPKTPAPAASGNMTASQKQVVPPPDTTAPVISGIKVKTLSANSVEIQWVTDEPSTSQAIWNAENQLPNTTPQKEAMVRDHSVELNNLPTKTTYYFTVRSVDESGNEAISERKSFDVGKQPGNVKMDVLMYSMSVEEQPPAGMKTYVRGQVINHGDSPADIKNVQILIKYTVPGKGAGEVFAALDPYPTTIGPGETQKFYALVPNGADPTYTVSVSTINQ